MKWRANKADQCWYNLEVEGGPYAKEYFIAKQLLMCSNRKYCLRVKQYDHYEIIGFFKKLASAKLVADLIING